MTVADTTTPNLKLTRLGADRLNWSEKMNRNMTTLDATVGAYFVIQNLQGVWENSTVYAVSQTVIDEESAVVYICNIAHTSASIPTTFAEDRTAHASFWSVYSSPARSRGEWLPNTAYALNDFIVADAQYAICIETHVSSATFAEDLALSRWSVLVDLSEFGFMPDPVSRPNEFAVTNGLGTDYELVNSDAALSLLGFTVFTKTLVTVASAAQFRTAIDAAQNSAVQPLNSNLSAISLLITQPYGLGILEMDAAATARTYLGMGTAAEIRTLAGLGTVATLNTGISSGEIPILGASGLPAVSGQLLTSLTPANVAGGNLGATVIANLNGATNSLGADVDLDNTGNYFTGPTVAQGSSGTWFASGTITVGGAGLAAGDVFNVKLWDGTSVISSTEATYEGPSGSQSKSIALSGALATPAGDIRISVNCPTRTTNKILFNASGNSKDSTLTVFRIA